MLRAESGVWCRYTGLEGVLWLRLCQGKGRNGFLRQWRPGFTLDVAVQEIVLVHVCDRAAQLP
jgi:hypothetical protein